MPRIRPDEGLVPLPDTAGRRLLRGISKGPIPEFEPTEDQRHAVMVFAANGATRQVMADVLKIDVKTLGKHFAADIKRGQDHITGRVGFVIVRWAATSARRNTGSIGVAARRGSRRVPIRRISMIPPKTTPRRRSSSICPRTAGIVPRMNHRRSRAMRTT
jgi:hypothetical protein